MFKILAALMLSSSLQARAPWPGGALCAVSLTYDDGLASHIENAAPALRKSKLRATFYPSGLRSHAAANGPAWSLLIKDGHEIGSHSMEHPCTKTMSFVRKGFAIEDYDLARMGKELSDS